MHDKNAKDSRRIAGMLEQALTTDHPLYFFDLASALERTGIGPVGNPELLRAVCEQQIGGLDDGDITLFTPDGFYLMVGSCRGKDADALAARIDASLNRLFSGQNSDEEDPPVPLFRPAKPGEAHAADQMNLALLERAQAIMSPTASTRFDTLATDGSYAAEGVQLCFAPVRDMRRGTPMLFHCMPVAMHGEQHASGYRAFRNLTPQDYAALDCAMLEYGASLVRALIHSGNVAAVGVSVSAETLSWSRGRQRYQALLREIDVVGQPQLLPVIDGIAAGTPPERIAEMVGMLKPYARRVMVSLPDTDMPLDSSGLMGAAGFCLNLPWYADGRVAHRWARWLERVCAIQNAFSCITGVNTADALQSVRANPIRFAGGAALGPTALTLDAAQEYARGEGFTAKRDIA